MALTVTPDPSASVRSATRAARLITEVHAAGPSFEAAGRRAEIDRSLTPEVAARMRELGLFWLKTPLELGGSELDPIDFCDVLEELAYHDASAAWAAMVGNGTTGLIAGLICDEGVARIFQPERPLPIFAGQFAGRGRATTVDGGFRVTGRWSFCSGITHADWVVGGGLVDDGQPDDMRLFCVPKSEATVHDTWHVAGLQGTGSNDFSLDEHLIPTALTLRLVGERRKRGGPLFDQPIHAFVGNELGPVAVGIARRALDDMIELASATTRKIGGAALGERPAFHKTLGRAEAKLRSAQLLYRDAATLGWPHGGGDLDTMLARTTLAVETCLELVSELFRYGGGRVLSLEHPMQRHYRNLIAAAQHVFLTEENFELSGRALLERPDATAS